MSGSQCLAQPQTAQRSYELDHTSPEKGARASGQRLQRPIAEHAPSCRLRERWSRCLDRPWLCCGITNRTGRLGLALGTPLGEIATEQGTQIIRTALLCIPPDFGSIEINLILLMLHGAAPNELVRMR
jgi:hypothetical protein